jgi:hypothetical protein
MSIFLTRRVISVGTSGECCPKSAPRESRSEGRSDNRPVYCPQEKPKETEGKRGRHNAAASTGTPKPQGCPWSSLLTAIPPDRTRRQGHPEQISDPSSNKKRQKDGSENWTSATDRPINHEMSNVMDDPLWLAPIRSPNWRRLRNAPFFDVPHLDCIMPHVRWMLSMA